MSCRKGPQNAIGTGNKNGMGKSADDPQLDHAQSEAIIITPNPNYKVEPLPPFVPGVSKERVVAYKNPADMLQEQMMLNPVAYPASYERTLADILNNVGYMGMEWTKDGGVQAKYGPNAVEPFVARPGGLSKEDFIAWFKQYRDYNGDENDAEAKSEFERELEEEWWAGQAPRITSFDGEQLLYTMLSSVPENVTDQWLLGCYQVLGRYASVGDPQQRKTAESYKTDLDRKILARRSPRLREQAQAVYDSNNCYAGLPFRTPEDMMERAKDIIRKDKNQYTAADDMAAMRLIVNPMPHEGMRSVWIDGQIVNVNDTIPGYYERMDDPAWQAENAAAKAKFAGKETIPFVHNMRSPIQRQTTPIHNIPDDAKPEWVRMCYQYAQAASHAVFQEKSLPGRDPRDVRNINENSGPDAMEIVLDIQRRFPPSYWS